MSLLYGLCVLSDYGVWLFGLFDEQCVQVCCCGEQCDVVLGQIGEFFFQDVLNGVRVDVFVYLVEQECDGGDLVVVVVECCDDLGFCDCCCFVGVG